MKYKVINLSRLFFFLVIYLLHLPIAMAEGHSMIVEPDWLLSHINDENLIIVDVRENDKYIQSHIQNAVSLPVSMTFSKGKRPDLVAPISKIKQLVEQTGISNSSHVVLYEDGSFINAARVFWVLEVFGQTRVSVLNSGYVKWETNGWPVSNEVIKRKSGIFIPSIKPELLATSFQVRLAIDNPNHILIDARPTEEYMGLESRTKNFGHIPSAVNIPTTLNIDLDVPKIQPIEELIKLYGPFEKDKPITVYCNKGKQSALVYYVLRKLGYKVSAYDGSWYEWSNTPKLPISNPNLNSIP